MTECDEHKNSICRVCLKCDPPIHESGANIFEKTDDVPIYEKLNTIADVNIRPEDGFPDRICSKCLQELHDVYSFKLKCETSHNTLLLATNTNSDTNTDIKLEEDLYPEHEYLDNDMDTDSPPEQSQEEEIQPNAERIIRGIDLKQKEDHYNDSEYNEAQTPTDFDKKEENTNRSSPAQSHTQPNTTNTERPSKAIDLKLECHDCGGLFKSKCKIKVHWKKEHLMQYLTCNKCKTVCKSFKAYNNHKQKYSELCNNIEIIFRIEGTGKLRKFFCKQCEYTTTKRAAVKHHVQKHNGYKKYQCDLCPTSYVTFASLYSHKEFKHQIYSRERNCEICGEYIKGTFKFSRHMFMHKNKNMNREVSCEICHKVYKNKSILKQHMNKHTGKTYSCDVCSKEFNLIGNLRTHKKNVHQKDQLHICPICGFSNVRSTVVKAHIAKHNSNNCICTVCWRFYDNEVQLKLHKKRHSDRNNKCSVCDKTFFTRSCMLKHLNKVHNIYLSQLKKNPQK